MEHDFPAQPPAGRGVQRRRALASVGALVVGAGAIGASAGAYGKDLTADSGAMYNVRDFGAVGDGVSDDTDHLQQALDAARAGGGIVFLPPGVYLTRRLTLYSRVHLRGSGGDATVLKLAPRANRAILESYRFAEESAARSSAGISMFSVRDLTLDGNRAHGNAVSYGMRIYGYGYEISEVITHQCGADGIFSAWGNAADLPGGSHQMEARLTGLRSHDNGGHGVRFAGPHDSMFLNCLAFKNGGAGFHLADNAYGTLMVNCHAWGVSQNVSFELATGGIGCVNCYADLDGGVGVRISRNDCRWVGGYVVGNNHTGPSAEIGIQFIAGAGPGEPSGAAIDTQIRNCGTAAVDFGAERGMSTIRATLVQPGVTAPDKKPVPGTGLAWLGAPAPDTQVEITHGLGHPTKNLVVRPAFDLRAQPQPAPPDAGVVRVFARELNGKTQLCALFRSGAVQVLATEP
jgi:hypothetical protein